MRTILVLVLIGTTAACGGTVTTGSGGSQTGTTDPNASDPGGTTGTGNSSVPGGAGTGSGGSGGSEPAVIGVAGDPATGVGQGGTGVSSTPGPCGRTSDRASVVIKTPSSTLDCRTVYEPDAGQPLSARLNGIVTAVTPTSFTLDTCPPNADCTSQTVTIEVTAPGIKLPISVGNLVQAEYRFVPSHQCLASLEVQSVPDWAGMQSPQGPYRTLLFAMTDGEYNFDDSPYLVQRTRLSSCSTDSASSCTMTAPGNYAFTFTPKASTSPPVEVRMGETKNAPLQSPKGLGTVMVRNLRSYETGYCDDNWNFAYYMYWQPPTR